MKCANDSRLMEVANGKNHENFIIINIIINIIIIMPLQ